MFDSGETAGSVIDKVKSELSYNAGVSFQDSMFYEWIRTFHNTLYREVVKDIFGVTETCRGSFACEQRFDDIVSIIDTTTNIVYRKSTRTNNTQYSYIKVSGDTVLLSDISDTDRPLAVYYLTVPYYNSDITASTVMAIPYEFIPMLLSYLRAESYKLINEDVLASKWAQDYNNWLETFKVWIKSTEPDFGC